MSLNRNAEGVWVTHTGNTIALEMLERGLPDYMAEGMEAWIVHGRVCGGFLTALCQGDLFASFENADRTNQAAMDRWVAFLVNVAPSGCRGSVHAVEAWADAGGLEGLIAAGAEQPYPPAPEEEAAVD